MKRILGLDLGTNSIGWAVVNEAENSEEKSSIIKLGVRVNPLTVDEQQNFEKGKSITTNADRTLKRSMRRNLQRYKFRRENLIEILKEYSFITDETILSENGNRTTFETYRLRAKAATEEISLEQFARVLLQINKKRGYKSSRKAKGTEDGTLIDGMDVAKKLYNENLTPGQFCLQLLQAGKKYLPDFYRSDLQTEFDKIWVKQTEFYPEILTENLKEELRGKKREAVWAICAKSFIWKETHTEWNNNESRNEQIEKEHKLEGIYSKRKRDEAKIENLMWQSQGLSEKLSLEQLVIVFQEINGQINGSSGYLGAISDRSKELYFNKQTVGQYQMSVLAQNPNASLRNMVFYRQDYLDEFNTIWETQAKFHDQLTENLKQEIRDVVIFYQRRLKSQKGLISFCEFESRQIEVEIDGKKKTKTVGSRVIPRSSPLFQEFKIWQRLNDIEVFPASEKNKKRKPNARRLEQDEKDLLFTELSVKEKLSKDKVLSLLELQEFDMNFNSIDGNKTQYELFKAYKKIFELAEIEIGDDFTIETIKENLEKLKINSDILYFDSQKELDEQPMYKLYHLLYSFEGDKSNSGIENLLNKLKELYGFEKEYARILAGVEFQNDYGNLSAKAIRKILPLMKMEQDYTTACANIYERHSKSSLTTEELENKVYKNRLDILPKNSLRNPVV
ncbi:MAG: type II CRISPR RNA-guided endonuclease Cas9, partial [Dysgonamonadaceae bacterium]|nr:type II CRISPR RNA-guided endonuclease Cas9 [Dysgonamonadaceae bacterium]